MSSIQYNRSFFVTTPKTENEKPISQAVKEEWLVIKNTLMVRIEQAAASETPVDGVLVYQLAQQVAHFVQRHQEITPLVMRQVNQWMDNSYDSMPARLGQAIMDVLAHQSLPSTAQPDKLVNIIETFKLDTGSFPQFSGTAYAAYMASEESQRADIIDNIANAICAAHAALHKQPQAQKRFVVMLEQYLTRLLALEPMSSAGCIGHRLATAIGVAFAERSITEHQPVHREFNEQKRTKIGLPPRSYPPPIHDIASAGRSVAVRLRPKTK